MTEKEIPGKNQIYYIETRYNKLPLRDKRISRSGHVVIAKSGLEALYLANKHNIGNPMGKADNVHSRMLGEKKPITLEYAKKRRGSIWYEDKDGKLKALSKS